MLSKLFASSKQSASSKRPASTSSQMFDPADELVVKDEKRRKKSTSQPKPTHVEMCLLPFFVERVPKGKQRGTLKEQGRIKKVTVSRHHQWSTIAQAIAVSFGRIYAAMKSPTILICEGAALSKAGDQTPNGDIVINRRGSFYISDGAPEDPICLAVSGILTSETVSTIVNSYSVSVFIINSKHII